MSRLYKNEFFIKRPITKSSKITCLLVNFDVRPYDFSRSKHIPNNVWSLG